MPGPTFVIPGAFGGGFSLKCYCSCWYCLCTLEGHCGQGKCTEPMYHPEDHHDEEQL